MDTLVKTVKSFIKAHVTSSSIQNKGVVEAYDIWAGSYDAQPGNLMLDLDQIVFGGLLNGIELKGKAVADIGCGTGRHWDNLFKQQPALLRGFDVSPGMIKQLKRKYPVANAYVITDNDFLNIAEASFDVIVSTLTVAHIKDIEVALTAWRRILKPSGDIIITDFHPNALANGGKRTFKNGKGHIAVENYVHRTETIKQILLKNGFIVINEIEKPVDEQVRHYYEAQNALHVYEQFKGSPIIYGIHFRRQG